MSRTLHMRSSSSSHSRPTSMPSPPAPDLIAPTGSPGVDAVLDVINRSAEPFQNAPPPEQGALGEVAQYAGGAMQLIGAPAELIDTTLAVATAGIAAAMPALPAVTLGAMHLGTPHTHVHPPSTVPPAPPIPLPSFGVTLLSGSISVLVGGLPAARAGDIGVSVTCGSLCPPFEIMTGSSNVFFGGSRAARMGDITRHCNPMGMNASGLAMGAAGVAAGALGAAAQGAGGNATAALVQGAQAAADAGKMAMQLLIGKDPGGPPGLGALMGPPVPNVLVGGFPCPPVGDWAAGRLFDKLKKLGKSLLRRMSPRRGNGNDCRGGEPVYIPTGETYNEYTDYVSSNLLVWKRHYTTARKRRDSALGYCNRHFYERSLLVRLHKAVYTDWDGEEFEFPRFEKGKNRTSSNGYVLERITPERYTISTRGEPAMEFFGNIFDGELTLTKLTDGEDCELELFYDDRGRLCSLVYKNYERRTRDYYELHYDRYDRIEELVELPRSGAPILRAAYGYDAKGNIIVAQDAMEGRWRFQYDWRHCMLKQTDPNDYTYNWRYDAAGRCVETSGQDGLWKSEIEYFPDERRARHKKGDDDWWELRWDQDGFVREVRDPYGGVKRRIKDAEGRLVKEIEPSGQIMEWLYDANDAHYARKDECGILYPPERVQAQLPDPYARNFPNTPLERLYSGLIEPSKTAAWGVPFIENFGVMSQLLESVPSSLRRQAQDVFIISLRPLGAPTELEVFEERDALGRKIAEQDSLGRRQSWRFDACGNEVEHVDRDGKVHKRVTESWNLCGIKTNPIGSTFKYAYDDTENITVVVDSLGNVSRYEYDFKDRLTHVRRHGRLREEYIYDEGGHFVEKRDENGETLFRNEFHENHKVALRKLSSGGFHCFDYDSRGRTTEASTDQHKVFLHHDSLDRRILDQRDRQGLERLYLGNDDVTTRLFSKFLQNRKEQTFRTTTLEEPNGCSTHIQSEDTGLVLRQCDNGTTELSQYDHDGLLLGRLSYKRSSDGAVHSWAVRYRYSAEGDLLSVSDSIRGTTRYEVDDAHRLIGEVRPDGQKLTYDLDEAGNVLGKPGLPRVELDSGNRLRATSQEIFEYDHRNHISTRKGRDGSSSHYVYDSFDMLERVVRTDKAGCLEYTVELEHDALNRLVSLRCEGLKREFYWDGDRLAAEVQPNGSVRLFSYGSDDSLVPLSFTEYENFDADPDSGKTYSIFSDQVGMPLHIEDESGAIVWWADRVEPYGLIHVNSTSPLEYNVRWPGHYFDPITSLHYNRRRAYDPVLGRYLQSDPIGHKGSEYNLYAYCPNPLVQVDVLGLHPGENKQNTDSSQDSPPRQLELDLDGSSTAKRLSPDELQRAADDIHTQVGNSRKQRNSTTTVTQGTDANGRIVHTVTYSDGTLPVSAQTRAQEILGPDTVVPQNRRDRLPNNGHHSEQRGISATQGQTDRSQASSSGAKHGGAACGPCADAQDAAGVTNVTGIQGPPRGRPGGTGRIR